MKKPPFHPSPTPFPSLLFASRIPSFMWPTACSSTNRTNENFGEMTAL